MTEYRRYTKRKKVSAVAAAVATSTLAAAQASGVPESTLRYWMESSEFANIRDKAREALPSMATVAAYLAWEELLKLLRSGQLDPREVIVATSMATDKSQLLTGNATSRSETRTLTDGLDDHEKQVLRDLIDGATAESAEASAGSDPLGIGTEVRE